MTTMNVQKFLVQQFETTGSTMSAWETLTNEFGIKVKHYPEHGITICDYDQINSPKMHPIVIECRSLILNTHTFGLVSKKFNRFFNYGECPEYYSDFNWETALVTNKYDGSLIGVYCHNGIWYISTRGMAFAEGNNSINTGTFCGDVMRAFGFKSNDEFQNFMNNFHEEHTLVFEYCSPMNRIVTPYSEEFMVLTGVNIGGVETDYNDMVGVVKWFQNGGYNVRLMETYPMPSNHSALVTLVDKIGDLQEGYVVWDEKTGKRCKFKAKLYVTAHSMRGNDPLPSKKNLLNLYFSGDLDEFVVYFPEWKPLADSVVDEIHDTMENLHSEFEKHKNLESQKEFALAVKNVKFNGILFTARKQGCTPDTAFKLLDDSKKISMFLGV